MHEYIRSLTAYKLGDKRIKDELKKQGRLSPNPLKHMDPLGGLFMLFFAYGWSNPPRTHFVFPRHKQAAVIVFLMPFLVNIALGAAFALARQLFISHFVPMPDVNLNTIIIIAEILRQGAIYCISFALFNLLPIYPLSGFSLVSALSPETGLKLAQAEKFLQILLVFAIIMGFAAMIFDPLTIFVLRTMNF